MASTTDNGATIHIGTRQSALALKQTDLVISALKEVHPHLNFQIHGITTTGDKDQKTALYNFGGKGLWTSELEAMLVAGQVDMIVHSLKDMPTALPEGCILGCITAREDPRDVIVFKGSLLAKHKWRTIADLPAGSVIGTSSIRRIAQLSRRYPALKFADIRGNIETRLRKLDADDSSFSAIILAAAGLLRMDFGNRIAQYLESETGGILHAVGQGGLGIEIRKGDDRMLSIVRAIEDQPTMLACVAERSVMRSLEGGCSIPIGVETSWSEDKKILKLRATVVQVDGSEGVDAGSEQVVENAEDADAFGKKVAEDLVGKGANKILDIVNQSRAAQTTIPTAK